VPIDVASRISLVDKPPVPPKISTVTLY
jgi:hypothetical protein